MNKILAAIFFIIGAAVVIVLFRHSFGNVNVVGPGIFFSGSHLPAPKPLPTKIISETPRAGVSPTAKQVPSKPVRITGVASYTYPPIYGVIYLSSDSLTPINITGWKVKSKKDSFVIPQAFAYYSGDANDAKQDIVLNHYGRVSIYSHTGAIVGGFNINKCFGYLTRAIHFVPSIYGNCPYIVRENLVNYSSQCQDYIRSLGSCDVPSTNPPIRSDDSMCFDFLKKLNYASCVSTHKNDADYLTGEWHIWLGDSSLRGVNIFDPAHDKVDLYDKSGALIDEYIY